MYFKNVFNATQVRESGEIAREEDYFPPEWISIEAPTLDRKGKWVQELSGDVFVKGSR